MTATDRSYFFVAGPPKGGTTWLMRLLDAHPEAACSGEGHYFDRLRPLFLRAMQEYQKLLALDEKLVFSGKPVLGPLKNGHIDLLLRTFVLARFHEHDPQGRAKAHGDKTPNNWKDARALFAAFPDATLIFINRDPRDAAVSLFGHGRRRQLYKLDPEGPIDRDKYIRAAAHNWVSGNKALLSLRKERPEQVYALTYEDLLTDTPAVFGELCARLGLSTDPEVIDACVEACSFARLSGRDPGKRDETSFFTSGTSGGWKEALSADEAQLVVDLCGPLMEGAGYTV